MGIHPLCRAQDGPGVSKKNASPARESHWMQIRQSKRTARKGGNSKRPHLVEVHECGGVVNVPHVARGRLPIDSCFDVTWSILES